MGVYDRPAAHKSIPDWPKQSKPPLSIELEVSQKHPPQVARRGDGVALRTQLLCSLRRNKKSEQQAFD